MSEHPTKSSPVAAVIVLIVIAGLLAWIVGLGNSMQPAAVIIGGLLFLGFGIYVLAALAKD